MTDSTNEDTKVATSNGAPNTTNRGIPPAHFIEDVAGHVASTQQTPDVLLKTLHSLYGKYKFMESELVTQQKSLLTKQPDIESALNAVQYLQKHKGEDDDAAPLPIQFELADSIHARAEVEAGNDKVLLWLGANVMLEYTYEEAEALLSKNLENCKASLESLESDLSFLKDQITISEVNIARVHNLNVAIKNEQKKSIQQSIKT